MKWRWLFAFALTLATSCSSGTLQAEDHPAPMLLYTQLRAFPLSGERVSVDHLATKRDRISLEWSGDFYPAAPIAGKVYGAVFIGQGRVMVEPYSSFEKESVQRFLKSDRVDLNFTTAVLRFTDDTYDLLAKLGRANGGVPPEAQKLAAELDPRLVRETGLNLSARILSAIVNGDQPGVFFGEFNGGKRGRFDALLDHQTQALQTAFGINAGEKGLLFQHASVLTGTDVWTAFYDEQDFRNGPQ